MSESDQQRALAMYLDTVGVLWCHVPNEAKRSYRLANKLKAEGVKSGVPDVLIFTQSKTLASEGVVGVAIELKNGRTTATVDQQQWLTRLESVGWLTSVQPSASSAIDWLKGLGYP